MILTKNIFLENKIIKQTSNIQLIEKLHKYDYVYVDMNQLLSYIQNEEFHKFQNELDENLIYTAEDDEYGIDRNHHITLFYGLLHKENSISTRSKLIKQFIYRNIDDFTLAIKEISFFRHDDSPYDVMKFDIESDFLNKVHYFIEESFENENTFKEYQPHMTIAYIKKGAFSEYEGLNTFSFCNTPIVINEIVFQDIYDTKKVITI